MVGLTSELEKLGDQFTVLIICPVQKLQDNIDDIVKMLAANDTAGIYISLSKPYKTLEKIFAQKSISADKIFFIDCITHSTKEPIKDDKVLYLNNAGDLNSIGISITQYFESAKGIKFLLIDALETLLIYNRAETIAIFVESLIEKSSKFDMKTVILTPQGDKELIDKIGMFFDKIIEVK
jgi:hypothetical protein